MNKPTDNAILFVHPILWGDFAFSVAKQSGYRVIALVTPFETTQINPKALQKKADYCLEVSGDAGLDVHELQAFMKRERIEIKTVINGLDAGIYYTDYLRK